jgi:hypothetical protein
MPGQHRWSAPRQLLRSAEQQQWQQGGSPPAPARPFFACRLRRWMARWMFLGSDGSAITCGQRQRAALPQPRAGAGPASWCRQLAAAEPSHKPGDRPRKAEGSRPKGQAHLCVLVQPVDAVHDDGQQVGHERLAAAQRQRQLVLPQVKGHLLLAVLGHRHLRRGGQSRVVGRACMLARACWAWLPEQRAGKQPLPGSQPPAPGRPPAPGQPVPRAPGTQPAPAARPASPAAGPAPGPRAASPPPPSAAARTAAPPRSSEVPAAPGT